jgi:NAD(P)-dependent dehydrogenase (short-subunit alcohol dehydrogenase family)
VAERFIHAGAQVCIASRRDGAPIAEQIGASFIRCDVSVEAQHIAMFEEAENRLGKLDIVINNAGLQDTGPTIVEHSSESLEKNIGVMLNGVYFGLKYGPGHMHDGGSVINTSSVAGLLGVYGYGQYSLTKAAVINLTKTSAVELASRGIRVNAVCPGTVKTAMVPDGHPEISLVEVMTPLGRIAQTEDIVGLYHFLASDESRYLTGQAIVIDGGLSVGPSVAVMERILSG